jgi:hypothetical protein
MAREGLGGGGGIHVIASTTGTNTYVVSHEGIEEYGTADTPLVMAVTFAAANTGASTINVNGMGARAITVDNNVALVAGEIAANSTHVLVFNVGANNFRLISQRHFLRIAQQAREMVARPIPANLNDWLPTNMAGMFYGESSTAVNAPRTGWFRYIGLTHGNAVGWATILACDFNGNAILQRTRNNGTWSAWADLAAWNTTTPNLPAAAAANDTDILATVSLLNNLRRLQDQIRVMNLPAIDAGLDFNIAANLPLRTNLARLQGQLHVTDLRPALDSALIAAGQPLRVNLRRLQSQITMLPRVSTATSSIHVLGTGIAGMFMQIWSPHTVNSRFLIASEHGDWLFGVRVVTGQLQITVRSFHGVSNNVVFTVLAIG